MQGTPAKSPLPQIIERNWAPPPPAQSPPMDHTYEGLDSPMEVSLEVSYFPDDDVDDGAPMAAAEVRAHQPSPIPQMSITAALMRSARPGLQRMPTYLSPRPTIMRLIQEPCPTFTRDSDSEHGLHLGFALGLLLSPLTRRVSNPEPFVFPPVVAREEAMFRLDDSPFTPGALTFNEDPVVDPIELFVRDFPITPGPRPLTPPMFDSSEDPIVSPSELELRDFPLSPGAPVVRFSEAAFVSREGESDGCTERPSSPVDVVFAEYMFGVYL
ncbi:hypothetical protein DAEQUDRAFT_727610 [Daedalea quercina L-15889]|uniref:Uncharacterized protein n=1 Tax=Daedalea quercina L-15889 TaxID=1314783 RepID=A0A165PX26_9APHY|nr:hypothetical protein DAEQUDRAFT_727610 [Daedalea quercina L-15889]